MTTKNTVNAQASKLVVSLEAKIKKLQSKINQTRTKNVSDAKAALASASKAAQKGKKDVAKLSAKLKSANASAKKAKTVAAKTKAKKRVNTAKTALTKQKTLVNPLSSIKIDLVTAIKSKKDADALDKAVLRASKELDKINKKKMLKKVKAKSTANKKSKKSSAKPVSKTIKKMTKIEAKQSKQSKPVEVATSPVIETAVTAPVIETQIAASMAPAPLTPNSSIAETTTPQETRPLLKPSDSLFDSNE